MMPWWIVVWSLCFSVLFTLVLLFLYYCMEVVREEVELHLLSVMFHEEILCHVDPMLLTRILREAA